MVKSFDAIATDPRITRARCEEHIAGDDVYLDGEFLGFASGGSSGVRALGVAHWRSAAAGWASLTRFLMRWARRPQGASKPGRICCRSRRSPSCLSTSAPPWRLLAGSAMPAPQASKPTLRDVDAALAEGEAGKGLPADLAERAPLSSPRRPHNPRSVGDGRRHSPCRLVRDEASSPTLYTAKWVAATRSGGRGCAPMKASP